MKIAACNIVGPDGLTVYKDHPIPEGWPEELIDELERGGGVVEEEVPDVYDEDAHYSGPGGE